MNLNFSEINREFPIQLWSIFGLLVSWSAYARPFLEGLPPHPGDNLLIPWSWDIYCWKKSIVEIQNPETCQNMSDFPPLGGHTENRLKLSIRLPTSTKLEQVHHGSSTYDFPLCFLRVSNSIPLSTHHPHSLQWLQCGSSHSSCDLPQGPSEKISQSGLWSHITKPFATKISMEGPQF